MKIPRVMVRALREPSMNSKQRMVEYPVPNLGSRRLTIVARGSEVNASKDSSIPHFVERLREAPEGAGHTDQEVVVHGEMPFLAGDSSKNHCRRAADRRVTRRVLRVRWCCEQRHP